MEIIDILKINNIINMLMNFCLSNVLFELKKEIIITAKAKKIKKTSDKSGKTIKRNSV